MRHPITLAGGFIRRCINTSNTPRQLDNAEKMLNGFTALYSTSGHYDTWMMVFGQLIDERRAVIGIAEQTARIETLNRSLPQPVTLAWN